MKKAPNKDKKEDLRNPSEEMKALYDQTPYPEAFPEKQNETIPLLEHWVNGFSDLENPPLHAHSRILIAGCGSGAEAIGFGQIYTQATIVGIDFSERSIEIAKNNAQDANVQNVSFFVADLLDRSWITQFQTFDFILCHAVADYVSDPSQLMKNLGDSLSPQGLIYMSVNSPFHPAGRIRNAFETLGIKPIEYEDSPEQRALFQTVVSMMGKNIGIENLGSSSKAYLNIDIFPPIVNHLSIEEWKVLAAGVNLQFRGSFDILLALQLIKDDELPPFYVLNRSELSELLIKLRALPAMQLIFSKNQIDEPDFGNEKALLMCKFRLASCVGLIPEQKADPELPMNLTLQFHGLPDFNVYTSAFDLEVFRRCDGNKTLEEILDDIGVNVELNGLKACLYRAYQYGILNFQSAEY